MSGQKPVFIAMGGNLPYEGRPPLETITRALVELEERGIQILKRSGFWSSPAWPDPTRPEYVNAAAEVSTSLEPLEFLAELQDVESQFGRERKERWGERTLDLDIIDFRAMINKDKTLGLPHPRLRERAFVLLPLREIAPNWRDPEGGLQIDALIDALPEADRQLTRPIQN